MAQEYKIINENINESGGITDSEISYVSTTASTVTFAGLNATSITGNTVHGSFYGNADNLTINGLNISGISKVDNVVVVGKSGDVSFTSIRDAVNSITDSSTVNPYAVLVSPGMYVEGPITMKTGVFVVGDSLGSVLVVPTGTTDTMFIGADGSSINNLILTSASSGLAVYHKGSGGTGFLIKDCNFNGNQTNVHCYGETSSSIVYIDRCSFTGNNTRGIIVDNLTGTTSQVVLTNSTYKDIIPPVTTEFIVVSGSNTTFTMTNTTLRSSGGTCVTVYDGGEFRGVGSSIRGFDTAITTLNIGDSPNLVLDGVTIGECTNDLTISHTGTTGYFNGVTEYTKTTIVDGSNFYIYGVDSHVITVAKEGKDFTSIAEAVNSITDATEIHKYVVSVGPGIYTEPVIIPPSYVSIVGSSINTTVVKPDGNHDIFQLINPLVELSFLTIEDAPIGYCGIRVTDCDDFAQAHKLTFNNCHTNVIVESSSVDSYFYGEYMDFSGDFTYGVKIIGTGSTTTFVNLENFYIIPNTGNTPTGIYQIGLNSELDLNSAGIYGNGNGTGIHIEGGRSNISGTNIKDWSTGISVPNGGETVTLQTSSIIFETNTDNIIVTNTGTTGYFIGYSDISKTNIVKESGFFITNKDTNIITVAKKGGDFNSIYDAVNFITSASTNNRYVVQVGPGTYVEPEIDLTSKPYVTILGESQDVVVVRPDTSNHHVFNLGVFNEIQNITVQNAGSGYAAFNMSNQGDTAGVDQLVTFEQYSRIHRVSIEDCDIGINVYTSTPTIDTMLYGEFVNVFGNYSYGVKVENAGGICACMMIVHLTMNPNSGTTPTHVYVTGDEAKFETHACMISGNLNDTGFVFRDGSVNDISATLIDSVGTAISLPNIGTASKVICTGVNLVNCTNDLDIDHTTATVIYNGTMDYSKVTNASSNFTFSFLDPNTGSFEISNKLNMTYADGTRTDLSTIIAESATQGVYEGGVLTHVSGLTINVSAGFGYHHDFPADDVLIRHDWVSTNLALPSDSNSYVYFNYNDILSYGGTLPNMTQNIVLGRVVTDSTSVRFIDASPMQAEHTSNSFALFNRTALGPVYSTGSIVTNVTGRTLNVSGGDYFFSENRFQPTGGNGITFTQYYRDGVGGWVTTATTVVNNTSYDGNGSLSALTTSYYTKHTLYVVGDGSNEKYFLVLGQNEYSSLVTAEGADLPTPPTYFTDSVTSIASIYVQQGFSGITQIEDIRPIIGFKAGGVSASAVHGNLLGLSADDHTQYLLIDGSRAMSGDLLMGGNDIISAGTINNVTIQTHASRHQHGGADEVGVSTPSANAIPKADINGTLDIWVSTATTSTYGRVRLSSTPSGNDPTAVSITDNGYKKAITGGTFTSSTLSLTSVDGTQTNLTIPDYYVTGGTYSNGTLTLNRQNGVVTVTGLTSNDTYVTGFTYSSNNFTISQNGGQPSLVTSINSMTGLTVNGTLSATTLQVTSIKIDGPTVAGYVLTADANGNGTWQVTSATGTTSGGGSSRITGSTTTSNATPTIVDTIDTIPNNTTSLIEVYVKSYQSGGTQWGIWKRTLAVTKVSNTVTIQQVNADVDKQSSGLKSFSLSFTVNSGNIDIYVTGIAATTISWNSAYEIIV